MGSGSNSSYVAARRLGGALEPVIGAVFFAPEAHQQYEELGFAPSPGRLGRVAMPERVAYATSRGSLLGDARGSVVAAAFGVFEPRALASAVEEGWTKTDAATIGAARERGALAHLERVLGADAEGRARVEQLLSSATEDLDVGPRALAAGAMSAAVHDHPFGTIFRRGEVLREFRGDSHNAAWADAGLDAVEIGLLTELYWGLPLRSYARTRGWSSEQFDAAQEGLVQRGLIDGSGAFTDAGRSFREDIEIHTDRQMAPVLDRLGESVEELIGLLRPWGEAIRAAGGYPASGPHDLAAAAG